LENEASKLHIPTLLAWDRMKPGHARIALLGLPGANEAIVDAWLRELGASNQVNRGSSENQGALLDNIRQAWFGGDLNQNYQLDPMERRLMSQNANRNRSASGISNGLPNESVALTPLQRYLTWYSGHRNLTRNGTPRVNLNDPDLSTLHRNLSAVWSADRANFVIAMRQFGPGSGAPNAGSLSSMPTASPQVETVQNWSPDLSKSAVYTFRSPLDLVGAVVDLPPAITSSNAKGKPGLITSAKRFVLSSFSSDLSDVRNYLNNILDTAAIDFAPISVGRIDAYEAPLEVLAGVPGLDLTLAQRIVQHRSGAINTVKTDDGLGTIAWLVDVMELAKLKELEPYLTGRSDVYSVQSIGYRDNKSAVYRITAVIDASENPTQLRNSKIWQPWDRGFSIDELIGSKP